MRFLITFALIAGAASGVFPSNGSARPPELRGASRDAINAAWLMASLSDGLGRDQPHSALPVQGGGDSTFGEVRRLCHSMGLSTVLRTLTFSELCSLHQPSVVLLRDGFQSTGYFAVVLYARPDQVTVVTAGWMTVGVFTEDEFRLRWSGHALVSEPYAYDSALISGLCIAFGIVCSFGFLSRCKKKAATVLNSERMTGDAVCCGE